VERDGLDPGGQEPFADGGCLAAVAEGVQPRGYSRRPALPTLDTLRHSGWWSVVAPRWSWVPLRARRPDPGAADNVAATFTEIRASWGDDEGPPPIPTAAPPLEEPAWLTGDLELAILEADGVTFDG
jgi:hypothetical protein